ncbi:MAG: hypothetical protein HC940_09080 [Acaryochloris sp. SU_5_25]|nr:hypothetical protein [Acaryochloris sp. SU_5_25]
MSSEDPESLTKSGAFTRNLLRNIWEPLDHVGHALMGDLWRTVYLSVQDAIALSTLLQVPSWVGRVIIGRDFASFDVCQQENPLGVARYACYIIVTSDFLLWILLASRILGRFIADFRGQWQKPRKSDRGSR